MSRVPDFRAHDPIAASTAGEPHSAVVGMTVEDARRHLAAHGLTLVVFRQDGRDVPDADLSVRGGVLVTVRGVGGCGGQRPDLTAGLNSARAEADKNIRPGLAR